MIEVLPPLRKYKYDTWRILPVKCYVNNSVRLWSCIRNINKYLLMTTLISGPKQASIDIDVFLEPLMEDMQKLWEHGLNVWDEYKKEHFNLNAIIFCTINDNHARLALIG
jgi:hypothetical protein